MILGGHIHLDLAIELAPPPQPQATMEMMEMDRTMVNLENKPIPADLNRDALREILTRSSNGIGSGGITSYIRFSKVCSSWRSAAAANPYKPVPWLMLSNVPFRRTRGFLCLGEKQIHEIKFSDEVTSSWCCGSSEGWLVMYHQKFGNFLYNPITRQQINLPRRFNLLCPEQLPEYLSKAIVITSSSLSSSCSSSSLRQLKRNRMPLHDDPTKIEIESSSLRYNDDLPWLFSQDYYPDIVLVVAILAKDNLIGLCRPGATEWEILQPSDDRNDEVAFDDIILYHGAIYLVTHGAAKLGVIQFNTTGTNASVEDEDKFVMVTARIQWLKMVPKTHKWILGDRKYLVDRNYLVESSGSTGTGDLLMVARLHRQQLLSTARTRRDLETLVFLVFRLDESTDPLKWVRIESLGDQILFLGTNHSKSIPASDTLASSTRSSSAGNCIYFTKDYMHKYFTEDYMWLKIRSKDSKPTDLELKCNNDVGVFYLEDEKIDTSFGVIDNNGKEDMMKFPIAFVRHPAIFITPNPSQYSPSREVMGCRKDMDECKDIDEYLSRYSVPILGNIIAIIGIILFCSARA